jgi:hypothetical protein
VAVEKLGAQTDLMRAGEVLLSFFSCFALEQIAHQDKTKKGTPLSHETLKHIKSLISGVFAHAKRQGFSMGQIPCRTPRYHQHRRELTLTPTAELKSPA